MRILSPLCALTLVAAAAALPAQSPKASSVSSPSAVAATRAPMVVAAAPAFTGDTVTPCLPVTRCEFVSDSVRQATRSATRTDSAPSPSLYGAREVVSVNPIGILFGAYGVEYERGSAKNAALSYGGSVSYWGLSDFKYVSVDAKVRMYPNGESLRGFYFGGVAGMTHVGAELNPDCTNIGAEYGECQMSDGAPTSANAINLGVELGGQWMFGAKQNTTFAVGGGAKKLIFVGSGLDGARATLPFLRLSLGYRFR